MTEEKQVKGQGGECEVIPFAKVQKAARPESKEERERRLEQMAAQVKLKEELRKPARISDIVRTRKMIREIERNCLAQADCALLGMAVLSIRARRGILGRILRRPITIDDVRREIMATHALREKYIAEGRAQEEAKGKTNAGKKADPASRAAG
jgi:hypothetical protein